MEVYSVKGADGERLFADREKAVACFRESVIKHWKSYQEFVGEMQGLSEDDIWKDMFLEEYDDRETQVCWSNWERGEDWLQWSFYFYDFLDERESEYCFGLSKLTVEQ